VTAELREALVRLGASLAMQVVGGRVLGGGPRGERIEQAVELAVRIGAREVKERAAARQRAGAEVGDAELLAIVREVSVIPADDLIAKGEREARGI
jgi:hypothetical protein